MEKSNVEILQKIKVFLEDHSPKNYSIILATPAISFIFGFLIWNTYLYTFGFVVNELFRSQFILTGLVFLLISFIIFILLKSMVDILKLLINNFFKKLRLPYLDWFGDIKKFFGEYSPMFLFYFLVFWFFLYTTSIFPSLPLFLGGGQPRALSLITTKENMATLKSLGIQNGEGAIYQTENLCVIYEDDQQIYTIREDRVLTINDSLFYGFGSLPILNTAMVQPCMEHATQWSQKGVLLSLTLLGITGENFWREIVGLAPKTFVITPR